MLRRSLAILAIAALAAVLAGVAVGRTSATPKLQGTVGPGYTISLKRGTKKVTKLKAGRYAFAISDKASIHSFVIEQQTGIRRGLTQVRAFLKKSPAPLAQDRDHPGQG